MSPATTVNFRAFPSAPKRNPAPLSHHLWPPPLPQPQVLCTSHGWLLSYPPSKDATPQIINSLLVKSKFSPLFPLVPCLYVKSSSIHSLNAHSFGLYEITLSWALSDHLNSVSCSPSLYFFSWMSPSAHLYSCSCTLSVV